MEPQQILNEAADLIEKEGWIQGTFHNEFGYCMVGALTYALDAHDDSEIDDNLWNKIILTAKNRVDGATFNSLSLTWWNDEDNRTKEEVLAVLRGN